MMIIIDIFIVDLSGKKVVDLLNRKSRRIEPEGKNWKLLVYLIKMVHHILSCSCKRVSMLLLRVVVVVVVVVVETRHTHT